MNNQKAADLIRACLDEMYQNSDPPITYPECEARYVGVDNWFTKHKIIEEKYDEIKQKYYKLLPKLYHRTLEWELLNRSPTFGVKSEFVEKIKDDDKL